MASVLGTDRVYWASVVGAAEVGSCRGASDVGACVVVGGLLVGRLEGLLDGALVVVVDGGAVSFSPSSSGTSTGCGSAVPSSKRFDGSAGS